MQTLFTDIKKKALFVLWQKVAFFMQNLPPLLKNLFLLLLSSFLFGLDNAVLSWVSFTPLFMLIDRIKVKESFLYGAIYGLLSSYLYAPWLINFNTIAGIFVYFIFLIRWSFLLFLLKIVNKKCKGLAGGVSCLLLVCYEWVKTQGFLGISYTNIGYTQYKNLALIQAASIGGVFIVSFILYLSSYTLFMLLKLKSKKNKRECFIYLAVFLMLNLIFYTYGAVKISIIKGKEKSFSNKITVCAVQSNEDPFSFGIEEYEKNCNTLIELSKKAQEEGKKIDLIVWPETAVVPSIMKNYSAIDTRRKKLVDRLLEFIDSGHSAFLIGNFHIDKEEKEFNAAFLFVPKVNTIPPLPQVYKKVHLVPFSETFPYKKQFPFIYDKLLDGGVQLWEAGEERNVLKLGGFTFGTPICFEDTFGKDSRIFFKNGAKAFINISNDSWGASHKCQEQHLKMAVFRSVENNLPTVRSATSGVTCFINRYGKITKRVKEFVPGYLIDTILY